MGDFFMGDYMETFRVLFRGFLKPSPRFALALIILCLYGISGVVLAASHASMSSVVL